MEVAGFEQDLQGLRGCRDDGRHNGRHCRLSKDREIGKTWDDVESFFLGGRGLMLVKRK